MSRASVLLQALTSEPTSTSDLYDRVGYPELTRVGLIPYHAFRAELAKLAAAGLARREDAPDGSTMWWREDPGRPDPPDAEDPGRPDPPDTAASP